MHYQVSHSLVDANLLPGLWVNANNAWTLSSCDGLAHLEGARPKHVEVLHEAVELGAVVGLEVGDAAGAVLGASRRRESQRLPEQHVYEGHLGAAEGL